MGDLLLKPEYYGGLLPYVEDENITDILWNGRHLWVKHLKKGKYRVNIELSEEWIKMFTIRLSHLTNQPFNYSSPVLEAYTKDLRFSVIHPLFSNQYYSLTIRKTPAKRRLNEEMMLIENYCDEAILQLLKAFILSDCSIIVIGESGSGKTELIKFLTKYIPDYQRTVTIEDKYELRLSSISPELDVVELKVDETLFTYRDAIKAVLQQDVHNLILQEVRGQEADALLEAASTGCRVMTTFHCDDAKLVPDRVISMIGKDGETKRNDIYSFFDIVIKVNLEYNDKQIHRWIDQIGILDRQENENKVNILYERGSFYMEKLSARVSKMMSDKGFKLNYSNEKSISLK